MRTINESLKTALEAGQGLRPIFYVDIKWDGSHTDTYCNVEYDDGTLGAYKFIEEVTSFDSVNNADGLGDTTSASFLMTDPVGHFKQMIDTHDPFDRAVEAKVRFGVDGYASDSRAIEIIDGYLDYPVTWQEDGKKLLLTISSKPVTGTIGYTPSIDDVNDGEGDYDVFKDYFTGDNWPWLWGRVEYYPLPKVLSRRYAEVQADILEDGIVTDGSTELFPIEIEGGRFTVDDTESNPEIYVNIVGSDQGPYSLILQGRFRTGASINTQHSTSLTGTYYFLVKDSSYVKDKITSAWFTNIACDFITTALVDEEEDQKTPNTKLELLLDTDEPDPPPDPGELGAQDYSGTTVTNAWLQFMSVCVHYDFYLDPTTVTTNQTANVIAQDGNIITLDRVLPQGSSIESQPYIKWAKKSIDGVFKIEEGAKVYLMADTEDFVVDLKSDTQIEGLYVPTGDGMKEIPDYLYTVYNSTPTSYSASGDLKASTGSSPGIWADAGYDQTPTNYTWARVSSEAIQRYLEQYEQGETTGEVWCTAQAAGTNSDVYAAYELLTQFCDRTIDDAEDNSASSNGDVTFDDVNFVFLDQEQIEDVVPEIMWQAMKGVSITGSKASFFNIAYGKGAPIYAFTDGNVLINSVEFGFTPVDDIVTWMDVQAVGYRYNKEPYLSKRKLNIDKYGIRKYQANFYIYSSRDDVKYMSDLWIDRLSKVRRTIKLTGFADAIVLEPWDRVSISLSDPEFYDLDYGNPQQFRITTVSYKEYLETVHGTLSTTPWQSEGWVREVRPRLLEGLVDVVIELDAASSDSPSQTIRVVS